LIQRSAVIRMQLWKKLDTTRHLWPRQHRTCDQSQPEQDGESTPGMIPKNSAIQNPSLGESGVKRATTRPISRCRKR
jgi:hypothetical protein